jgi:hypothetical protein
MVRERIQHHHVVHRQPRAMPGDAGFGGQGQGAWQGAQRPRAIRTRERVPFVARKPRPAGKPGHQGRSGFWRADHRERDPWPALLLVQRVQDRTYQAGTALLGADEHDQRRLASLLECRAGGAQPRHQVVRRQAGNVQADADGARPAVERERAQSVKPDAPRAGRDPPRPEPRGYPISPGLATSLRERQEHGSPGGDPLQPIAEPAERPFAVTVTARQDAGRDPQHPGRVDEAAPGQPEPPTATGRRAMPFGHDQLLLDESGHHPADRNGVHLRQTGKLVGGAQRQAQEQEQEQELVAQSAGAHPSSSAAVSGSSGPAGE